MRSGNSEEPSLAESDGLRREDIQGEEVARYVRLVRKRPLMLSQEIFTEFEKQERPSEDIKQGSNMTQSCPSARVILL